MTCEHPGVGPTNSGGRHVEVPLGELSFVLISGDTESATAMTGFIAAQPPYALALNEEQLWQQLRGFVVQLGYDQDGFYASIGGGGRHRYYEEYHQGR